MGRGIAFHSVNGFSDRGNALSARRDARNLQNVNYVNRFFGSIDINLRPREARKIIQISRNLFVNGNRFRAGRQVDILDKDRLSDAEVE